MAKTKTTKKKAAPKKAKVVVAADAPVTTAGIHGDLSTKPYCGQCGWKIETPFPDLFADGVCDSCGADLSLYGWGPPNPPSQPNGAGVDGAVRFIWTPSPATFPQGYKIRYHTTIDFEWVTVMNPVSPFEVVVPNGTTVCAQLAGKAEGVWSGWSFENCATAAP